jgi:bacteriorhodopsin
MSALYPRSNDAVIINPSSAHFRLTDHGSSLDWAIMTLNAVLLLAVLAWTFMTSSRRRVFHYFSILILFVATIYYFILASNLGSSPVPVEFRGKGLTRQVYYARWVGYTINFTLIIFALLLLSGVGWAPILFTLMLTIGWGSMFLIGMFISTTYKWGFFVFGVVLYFLIIWQVLGNARGYSSRVETHAHRSYIGLAAWTIFFMMLYPIAWGVSEGGNRIKNDSAHAFYAVLDVFSQGVFAVILLIMTKSLDFDVLHLGFTEYGRVHLNHEKSGHRSGHRTGENMAANHGANTVPTSTV